MKAEKKYEPLFKHISDEAKQDIMTLLNDNNITSLNVTDYVNEIGVMSYGFNGCDKNGYGVCLTIDTIEIMLDDKGRKVLACDMIDECAEPFDTYYISLDDDYYDTYGYFSPSDIVSVLYLIEEIVDEIEDGEPIIKKGESYDNIVE